MSNIPEKFLSPYNSQEVEERINKVWKDSGFYNPDICVEKGVTDEEADTFSMVLPPPNVTGKLHIGHASMVSIEDIMVRFERMRGKRALWIPGTDHAAIATQTKVEKKLKKEEGLRRHDLGREEFLKRVEEFAQESHDEIVSQVDKLGASLDWSREAFTLDEKRSQAVVEGFKRMYEAGLIYRKERVVNWDPKGQTTISDDEIVHEEAKSTLYTFYYDKDFPIPIATTRPETKYGDTAVAVHPADARYREYIGKTYEVDFLGEPLSIKVVADEKIDPEFGTGAVGLTPAHSYTDWELAQKHDLELKQVINEYGKMMVGGENIEGERTHLVREKIAEKLDNEGLLKETETITNNISTAERSGGTIEPLPKLQWFVDVNQEFVLEESNIDGIPSGTQTTLKEIMRQTVESGQIQILPERFEKIYFHWIENLRDWCISRQIWYGHRIPVWYKDDEMKVSETSPGDGWEQDPDTLDTWFSSGMWTFSTLGWPEKTDDFLTYHPTDVLETGYDIIFFWVARMVLMTGFLLGDVPFRTVYLHGLVRDEHGRKISKSLGNNIDPVEIIEDYGADALRMSLIVGVGPGNDNNLGIPKVKAYRNFANKVWNIARFVLENTADYDPQEETKLTSYGKDFRAEVNEFAKTVTDHMENFRYYLAAEDLYHFIWHRFADEVLEESKEQLEGEDRLATQAMLYENWRTMLKLLHPFMPFLTEELWQHFKQDGENLLLVTEWPVQ